MATHITVFIFVISAFNSTLQRFSGVFGVANGSAVFASYVQIGSPASFTAGFRPARAIAAAFALVCAVSSLAASARRSQPIIGKVDEARSASFIGSGGTRG